MADRVRDVMTPDPTTVPASASVVDAAAAMRDVDAGAVVVTVDDRVAGIVTDRDIAVRVVAEGLRPAETAVGDICSDDLVTVSPSDLIAEAVELMRDRAVRRLPVVEGGRAVGILSIGDLAMDREPDSLLADISEAFPDR